MKCTSPRVLIRARAASPAARQAAHIRTTGLHGPGDPMGRVGIERQATPLRAPHSQLSRDREPAFFPFRKAGAPTALFRWLLPDPVAALGNGNDPDWRRYIRGTEKRCIGLVIGEVLIDPPQRVLS